MRVANGACTFQHDMEGMRGRCWSCGGSNHLKKDCPHKTALGGSNGGDTKTPRRVSKIKERMSPEKGSPGAAQGEKVAKVVVQDEIKGASTDGDAAEKEPVKVPVSVAPAQVQEAPEETAADLMKEAAGLLKSLRSVKSIKLKQVILDEDSGVGQGRALACALMICLACALAILLACALMIFLSMPFGCQPPVPWGTVTC